MIKDDEIKKCYDFSKKVFETTCINYKKRNPNLNSNKIIQDHFIAKITELHVYYFLKNKNYNVSYPDFKIYELKNKSHDADLFVYKKSSTLNIHIKSCRSDSSIKKSWLFQKKDSLITNPKENDFVCLCEYYNTNFVKIIWFDAARKLTFKPTIKNLPTKLAVYLKDITTSRKICP